MATAYCLVVTCLVFATILHFTNAKLLLISFDGFRWDYLSRYKTESSWFHYLLQNGASTLDGSIEGTFVTKTFPSHFTIVTGVYEETHGIVSNKMYDPENGAAFYIKNVTAQTDPFWWKGGTPIWIVAERQNHHAGTYFWPGSEVKYGSTMQKEYRMYNESYNLNQRIDTVVDWFFTNTVEFAALYYHEPDRQGHEHGPYSNEVRKAVAEVNDGLGYLIKKLKEKKLFDSTNIVVLSDHGMAQCLPSTILNIYPHLARRKDLYKAIINDDGPIVDFVPQTGKADELYKYLKSLTDSKKITNATVYKKEDVPERFHYQKNRRIPEVFILADLGFYLYAKEKMMNVTAPFGTHGYDNKYRDMRPIFIAHGPKFVPKARVKPFRQVDVYNLLAKVIGIQPGPNNGSWEKVAKLYNNAGRKSSILRSIVNVLSSVLNKILNWGC